MFFLYKQSKFQKQARACLWEKLVQAQSMLALGLFIKILLGVYLRKRLDQAHNALFLQEKNVNFASKIIIQNVLLLL